jgi:6-phosphofructokinase 2
MTESSEKPIAVLALNPAVDISYEIPQLVADQKVRSANTRYHPGGNGINVARSLTELGVAIHCCAVIGGESGSLLMRLLGDTLDGSLRHYEVAGETRLNAVLLQKHPPGQYEVDSVGPEIPPEVLWDLKDCFLESCADGIGVLTGSTPPGVPDDIYRELAERIRDQGGRAVVEAHGPVLKQALEAKPYLLRFNLHVLETTKKRRLGTIEAVAEAAREIQRSGVDLVCVTLGDNGALLVDADNSHHCSAPKVRVHSTVGCGDAVVAGMVCAASRGDSTEAMLRLGVMCGTATASHAGTDLFTREEIADTSNELEIRDLDI